MWVILHHNMRRGLLCLLTLTLLAWRLDGYHVAELQAPALRNLHWQHAVQQAERHESKPCTITVDCKGSYRLGNQITSMLHALHIARILRISLEVENNCFHKIFGSKPTLQFDFTPKSKGQQTRCSGTLDIDSWTRGTGVHMTANDWAEAASFLGPELAIKTPVKKSSAAYVVYLRAGDIICVAHPLYTQSPCSYFDVVLKDAWKKTPGLKLEVVTDLSDPKCLNPCGDYLVKKYNASVVNSGSVAGDWLHMATSHNFVLSGTSSFSLTAALVGMSLNMRHVHLMAWTDKDLRGKSLQELRAGAFRPRFSEDMSYAISSAMSRSTIHRYMVHYYPTFWSLQQVQQMLTYPEEMVSTMSEEESNLLLPPYVSQSLTLLVGCIPESKQQLVQELGHLYRMGRYDSFFGKEKPPKERHYFPVVVFVPSGWEDILSQLPPRQRLLVSVFTTKHQDPKTRAFHFSSNNGRQCLEPNVLPLLYALRQNPFNTTHIMWVPKAQVSTLNSTYWDVMGLPFPVKRLQAGSSRPAAIIAPTHSASLLNAMEADTYLPESLHKSIKIARFCESSTIHCSTRMPKQVEALRWQFP